MDYKQRFDVLCGMLNVVPPLVDKKLSWIMFELPTLLTEFCDDNSEGMKLAKSYGTICDDIIFANIIIKGYEMGCYGFVTDNWEEYFMDKAVQNIFMFFNDHKLCFELNPFVYNLDLNTLDITRPVVVNN